MPLNKTDIINAGLFAVGAKKIFAPADNTKAAKLASSIYEFVRKIVFEMPQNWKWCTTRSAALTQADTDPASGFDHQYFLPDNTVRVLGLVDPESGILRDRTEAQFSFAPSLLIERAGTNRTTVRKVIQANVDEGDAFIKYLVFIENEGLYPAWFAQLISLNIAVYIAEPLKQHTPHYTKVKDMLKIAVTFAEEANAMEGVTVGNTTSRPIDQGNDDLVNAGSLGFDGRYPYGFWGLG